MGTSSKDIFKYPVYQYISGRFVQIYPTSCSHDLFKWQIHHYIEQGYIKRNKLKFKQIEHLQKLFVLPTQCHIDLHNHIRNFEQKWGIAPEKLLYDYRDKLTEY